MNHLVNLGYRAPQSSPVTGRASLEDMEMAFALRAHRVRPLLAGGPKGLKQCAMRWSLGPVPPWAYQRGDTCPGAKIVLGPLAAGFLWLA